VCFDQHFCINLFAFLIINPSSLYKLAEKGVVICRPNDSRMVVALGEAYDRLDRLQEAKKCFWKAHSLGDVEGLALVKLAK